jgi:2',3'-cyclic-nucleotide 2'-phosphodiesterase/3'-nucleotidase
MNKRNRSILGFLLLSLALTSCGDLSSSEVNNESSFNESSEVTSTSHESQEGDVTLDLFALNDLHGSIFYSDESNLEYGMYKIGSYLREKAEENPDGTINMDVGDIWQGSADSNITRGKVLIEMFNSLDWAATTLGNHEFDWYDSVIEENRELANYPFLGANIINKSTGKRADNLVDGGSTLIERKGVKIGIIGTIGSSLESSILASAVAPYSLEPVTNYVIEESNYLREQGAKLIILLTHDSLTGYHSTSEYGPILEPQGGKEPYVDVVFTGHKHALDRQMVNGVPILQTNGNSRQLMHVNLTVTEDEKVFINSYQNVASELANYPDDPIITEVYAKYEGLINQVKNEVVGELTATMYKSELVKLATKTMLAGAQEVYEDVVVAIHNTGGVRVNQINKGPVTYGDIYKAFPFDNTVVVLKEVPGSVISKVMRSNAYTLADGVTGLEYTKAYTFVTINFISEDPSNYLTSYPQSVLEGVFVRDLIADYFRTNGSVNPYAI